MSSESQATFTLFGFINCATPQCLGILSYIVVALIVLAIILFIFVFCLCCAVRKKSKKIANMTLAKSTDATTAQQTTDSKPQPAASKKKSDSSSSSSESEDNCYIPPKVYTVQTSWQTNEMEMRKTKRHAKRTHQPKPKKNKVHPGDKH